jgi:hypothetical protein
MVIRRNEEVESSGSPAPAAGVSSDPLPGDVPGGEEVTVGIFRPAGEVKLEGPSAEDIAFYRAQLAGWREHTGEYVLVYQGKEHGFYPTRKTALKEGYRRFGRVPFLAKQVDPDEKPRPVARVIL